MTFLKRDGEFATFIYFFFFYWEHGRTRNSLMGKMEAILRSGLIAGSINTYISVHKTLN